MTSLLRCARGPLSSGQGGSAIRPNVWQFSGGLSPARGREAPCAPGAKVAPDGQVAQLSPWPLAHYPGSPRPAENTTQRPEQRVGQSEGADRHVITVRVPERELARLRVRVHVRLFCEPVDQT